MVVAVLLFLEAEEAAPVGVEEEGVHADAVELEVVEGAVCRVTSEVEMNTNRLRPLTEVHPSAA